MLLAGAEFLTTPPGARGTASSTPSWRCSARSATPNLARLLGFCAAGADRLLVYEFLARGSLNAWLYGDAAATGQRAYGVASALAFLHHGNDPAILRRLSRSYA
jgi:hypothetical protein